MALKYDVNSMAIFFILFMLPIVSAQEMAPRNAFFGSPWQIQIVLSGRTLKKHIDMIIGF